MSQMVNHPWLRNTMIVLGCLGAALIFPVVIYASIWAVIGLLTLWPSIWCLFTVAAVSAAALPVLIFLFATQLTETSIEDLRAHPVLHVAYGAALTGLIFSAWLFVSLLINLVPILGLAAAALGIGVWVGFVIASEVSHADAIQIKGTAGLNAPASETKIVDATEPTAKQSRLAEVLGRPAAVPVC